MRPVHDTDAILLMATTLSSKRRPAELVEIVAAADMIQGSIPYADKLGEAIERLTGLGLIAVSEAGFMLTAAAQEIMARQPKKAGTEELVLMVRDELSEYSPRQAFPTTELAEEKIAAAILAHKASKKAPGKNVLMPKAKPDRHFKVEGRWRRAPAKN
ncbi:MAG: hypothetical protein KJ787_14530 [Gammaproteobacteria bacterium]|nr:hypothetical protein [Gammaproteobacteria bacterium]MBU1972995.1 hypothetical protein [Gammaproteobacteria bacterium]